MSLTQQNNNNFFTRISAAFMPIRNIVIPTGICYLTYKVAYKLLENVNPDTELLVSSAGHAFNFGMGILTLNNFVPYGSLSTAGNIISGLGLGLIISDLSKRYIHFNFNDPLQISAIGFGAIGASIYLQSYMWYYRRSVDYCNECGSVICPVHSNFKAD